MATKHKNPQQLISKSKKPKAGAPAQAEETADVAQAAPPIGKVFANRIEMWPIDRFVPYVRNPRKHEEATVARMAGSIQEFGFPIPVLARSNGEVVDGHLRLKGANKAGLPELPVINCDGWSETQVKAFRIMANKSVMWAEWDDELLSLEMQDLKDSNFDATLSGFDEKEIEKLFELASGGFDVPDHNSPDKAGAELGVGGEAPPVSSHVRMLQVFVPDTEWDEFRDNLERLGKHFGTDTATDTVMAAVRACAASELGDLEGVEEDAAGEEELDPDYAEVDA